jgi:hypothetical protein
MVCLSTILNSVKSSRGDSLVEMEVESSSSKELYPLQRLGTKS